MIRAKYYDEELDAYTTLNNPNDYQVVHLLKSRDEEVKTVLQLFVCVSLSSTQGIKVLNFTRGKFDRFLVLFSDYSHGTRKAFNVTKSIYKTLNARIPIVYSNGEKDVIAISDTLSFEDTIKLALFFLQNENIPSDLELVRIP
jgi:hypothetical protein